MPLPEEILKFRRTFLKSIKEDSDFCNRQTAISKSITTARRVSFDSSDGSSSRPRITKELMDIVAVDEQAVDGAVVESVVESVAAVKDVSVSTFDQFQCLQMEFEILKWISPPGFYLFPILSNNITITRYDGVGFVSPGKRSIPSSPSNDVSSLILKFVIEIPESYPFQIPVIRLITPSELIHPLISPFSGKVDTNLGFSSWSPYLFLSDLMVYLKAILDLETYSVPWITDYLSHLPDTNTLPFKRNQAAVDLFLTDFESFRGKFYDSCSKAQCSNVYEDTDSIIRFFPFDHEKHQPEINRILNQN